MAPSSHRNQSIGNSTPKQFCQTDTVQRKKERSEYNYSISASDIDKKTLIQFLNNEFKGNFRVKVSFEQPFPLFLIGLTRIP